MVALRYYVVLLTFCAGWVAVSGAIKITVGIMNQLGHGEALKLHCRSRDDDLGLHTVADGGEFSWKFQQNIWGTTLFDCNLWLERPGYLAQFNAFDDSRDMAGCAVVNLCLWKVNTEALWMLNSETGVWDIMHAWP